MYRGGEKSARLRHNSSFASLECLVQICCSSCLSGQSFDATMRMKSISLNSFHQIHPWSNWIASKGVPPLHAGTGPTALPRCHCCPRPALCEPRCVRAHFPLSAPMANFLRSGPSNSRYVIVQESGVWKALRSLSGPDPVSSRPGVSQTSGASSSLFFALRLVHLGLRRLRLALGGLLLHGFLHYPLVSCPRMSA